MAVGLTAFLLALAGGAYYLYVPKTNTPHKLSQAKVLDTTTKGASSSSVNPTINSQSNQVAVTTPPTPTVVVNNGTAMFTGLGISFTYAQTIGGDTIATKVVGSKVYVYDTKTPYTEGQYVEVLSKNQTDSLSQAINSSILKGYNANDCPIKVENVPKTYPTSYQIVSLHYASNNVDEQGFPGKDPTKCPSQYTVTEGSEYFLMDTNHPDKMLFFYVPQYAIYASSQNNKLAWQDTISFL